MRVYLNNDWLFSKDFDMEMLESNYDTSNMESVRLPHSVVETPFNYFDESIYQMKSGYRKTFKTEESWKNKRVILTVEAAAHKSAVFINGELAIEHECGYTAYTVDITDYLFFDKENILVIYVDSEESLNQPPFGNVIDYMTYGGIYRDVYLDIKNKSYIKDVFTKVLSINDGVTFVSEVDIHNNDNYFVQQELYDINKKLIVSFNKGKVVHTVKDVELWNIDNPKLYYLKTTLVDEKIIDERWDRIGFRTVEFKSDGFYLNNQKIKIRGLNRHQSYPYVGYAMPKSMQVNDAKILKDLGLNAVRTSHYPQSHYFIDACDELGLLVFTEIPGWQHIGDEAWKDKAVQNTYDMVKQYRNHPSIFLWGVRINESMDDDEFYKRTNEIAHMLDDSRPTSGVRFIQKSSLLEDVYAYNDFSHSGLNDGCLPKEKVTSNMDKGYLISEYNGHMYPTKSFDNEDIRVNHMKRHAKVLDSYYGKKDIAGGFGWCMADYNTHKDFGSGDRICYHGVLDMFRNPKLASYVYKSLKEDEVILEVSSMMDIGEHPACLASDVYALTNADSVKLYKNDVLIKEFKKEKSPYNNLKHGPILIDDFIGDTMEKNENFSHGKAIDVKKILLAANKHGIANLPFDIKMLAAKCILFRGMKMDDAVSLYNKYVGNWGGNYTTYKFEAIKDGKVQKTVVRKPVTKVDLDINVSHTDLIEEHTYDVASIQIKATDEYGSVIPYYQESVVLSVEGPIEIIGPKVVTLRGGMSGSYIKTLGVNGKAYLRISNEYIGEKVIEFNISGGVKND